MARGRVTIEVIGSEYEQRQDIQRHVECSWSKLDDDTFNATVDEDEVDVLTEQIENYGLDWRLV